MYKSIHAPASLYYMYTCMCMCGWFIKCFVLQGMMQDITSKNKIYNIAQRCVVVFVSW